MVTLTRNGPTKSISKSWKSRSTTQILTTQRILVTTESMPETSHLQKHFISSPKSATKWLRMKLRKAIGGFSSDGIIWRSSRDRACERYSSTSKTRESTRCLLASSSVTGSSGFSRASMIFQKLAKTSTRTYLGWNEQGPLLCSLLCHFSCFNLAAFTCMAETDFTGLAS